MMAQGLTSDPSNWVHGWKSIAAKMGVSVRRAQKIAYEIELPIFKRPGGRSSTVVADERQLLQIYRETIIPHRLREEVTRKPQRESSKDYRHRKPHVGIAASARRRALKIGATVGDLRAITAWLRTWRTEENVICFWCSGTFRGSECHADHVVPLSRGGTHAVDNLVIACAKCNLGKGGLLPEEWGKKRKLNFPR